MSHSPRKFIQEVVIFRGDKDCKLINLESLEYPFVVPLMMNCQKDNKDLISSSITNSIQRNGTFLIDLDKLPNRKDVFADDNGAWTLKGTRSKCYSIEKDADGQVVALNKTGQWYADIVVRRRPYVSHVPNFIKPLYLLNMTRT